MPAYWLLKSEPDCFSIDDLAALPEQTSMWDGVRNYQARNFLRDSIKIGDVAFFYNSVTRPGIVGLMEAVSQPYPDPTQWDPENEHFDPASPHDKPRWFVVDFKLKEKFSKELPLPFLRGFPELAEMELLRKGSRLSVQPVKSAEFDFIMKLIREGSEGV